MIRSSIIPVAAAVAILVVARAASAAPPDCAPSFRVGNVIQIGNTDCIYTYGIDAACNAAGGCPDGNNCISTGSLTFAWAVTQTGGSGSIAVDRIDWMRINVTVVPPVTYTLQCTVGGCAACCAVPFTGICETTPVTVPAKASGRKSVRISKACD